MDSEHKKNLQNDGWRLYQLSKSTSNPQHPFHNFSTGSLETLRDGPRARGIDVRKEFMRFHEQHYSANRMKLVVLGRESLDELESWVVELFSAVQNKDLPQYRWDSEPVLSDKELLTQCFAKPVMENRSLELCFPFLDEEHLFESQPSRYISQLIGHEGPGSILAYIKSRGWATELSAGSMPISPGSSVFKVGVRLTEEGMKRYQDVVTTIFQYISLVREQPPLDWVVDEMKSMSEIDFRFKQKTDASRFTSKTSSLMHKPLPRAWLLSGLILIRKFDAEAIREGLSFLRPDNFRLTVVGPDFDDRMDQREQWYGTQYHLEKIPDDFRERIAKAASSTAGDRLPELRLPNKNDFIPTNFDVAKQETKSPLKAPKLVRDDDAARTWWKKDDTFWVPKGTLQISIRNPLVNVTPENVVKTALFTELVQDALVEYAYDAELAGLRYGLSGSHRGLHIHIQGYNDKMSVLLEKIVTTIRDFQVRPDRFDVIKERLLEEYQNWELNKPYHQVGDYSRWLDNAGGWINEHCLGELGHLEASDVQAFHPQLLGRVHLEVLAHGNFHKEEALKFTSLAEKCLRARPLPPSHWPVRRSLILPPGSNFTYTRTLKDPLNVNNCIHYVVPVGDYVDQPLRARLLLFAQITDEPAFDQLRTKEQLGYVVFSGMRTTATLIGYRVLIQSEKPAAYLEERIDAFLRQFPASLEEMSDETFEGHKRSLIKTRTEKPKNLGQETSRFSTHISNEYLDFELGTWLSTPLPKAAPQFFFFFLFLVGSLLGREWNKSTNALTSSSSVDKDVASIEPLTKGDIRDFYNHYINPDSPSRAKLSVYLQAQSGAAARSSDEAKTAIAHSIAEFLTACNVPVEAEKLQQRLAGVEVPSVSALSSDSHPDATEAVLKAVEQYLLADLGLDAAKASALLDSGRQAMGLAGAPTPSSDAAAAAAADANAPHDGAVPAASSTDLDAATTSDHTKPGQTADEDKKEEGAHTEARPSQAVVIEDVRDFKARLAVTPGARPVKPLSEYGELSAKL